MARVLSFFKKFWLYILAIIFAVACFFVSPHLKNSNKNSASNSKTYTQNYKNDKRNIGQKCNISDELYDYKNQANAGCLIIQGQNVLFVKSGKSNKFAIPGGGKKPDETSPCTAFRSTFSKTGIEVTVMKKILTTKNGFEIFLCIPKKEIKFDEIKNHKNKMLLISPSKIKGYKYPDQLEGIRKYVEENHSKDITHKQKRLAKL